MSFFRLGLCACLSLHLFRLVNSFWRIMGPQLGLLFLNLIWNLLERIVQTKPKINFSCHLIAATWYLLWVPNSKLRLISCNNNSPVLVERPWCCLQLVSFLWSDQVAPKEKNMVKFLCLYSKLSAIFQLNESNKWQGRKPLPLKYLLSTCKHCRIGFIYQNVQKNHIDFCTFHFMTYFQMSWFSFKKCLRMQHSRERYCPRDFAGMNFTSEGNLGLMLWILCEFDHFSVIFNISWITSKVRLSGYKLSQASKKSRNRESSTRISLYW